jgi:hypothetical protein
MIGYHPSKIVELSHHRPTRIIHILLAVLIALLVGLPSMAQEEPEAEATSTPLDWSFDPVFEQNGLDGYVLGAQGDILFSGFRPFGKLGYGLDSGQIRYEAGLGWENWSISMYNWADTHVLGRTGESGIKAGFSAGGLSASLRMAQLWLMEDETEVPEIEYLNANLSHTIKADFDVALTFSSNFTLGMLADGRMFESMRHGIRARWGDLRVAFSQGTSSNEAEVMGFEYTHGMRGYDDALKGHAFWRGRVERRARLLTVPLDYKSILGPAGEGLMLPDLAIGVDASGFGEVLRVEPNAAEIDPDPSALEAENYMGWGIGLVLVIDGIDFEIRFDLFFNNSGDIKPLFG